MEGINTESIVGEDCGVFTAGRITGPERGDDIRTAQELHGHGDVRTTKSCGLVLRARILFMRKQRRAGEFIRKPHNRSFGAV